MIIIRKLLIVISILILGIGLVFGVNYAKKYFAMKEIKNIAQQAPTDEETNENNNSQNDTNEEEAESRVKTYFSEKVQNAKQYFFNEDIHIVSIGDSLTQGVGDEENNGGYVGILDERINQDSTLAKLDNFGKAGNRTDQLIERLSDEDITAAIEQADIVIVTIGANDIMKVFKENILNVTLDKFKAEEPAYRERLQTIIDEISEKNGRAQIFLVGFYNPFKGYFTDIDELEHIVNDWNDIGESVVSENNQTNFVPIKDIFDEPEETILSGDNFHPNHHGYELIAERILENVANEGMVMYGSAQEFEEEE